MGNKNAALLIIGLGAETLQQFVGVNTVIYYAPTILKQTGPKADQVITQSLSVGVINVVFTIIAVLVLDKVGRRKRLISATIGLCLCLCLCPATLAVYFGFGSLQNSAPVARADRADRLHRQLRHRPRKCVGGDDQRDLPTAARSKTMSVTAVANCFPTSPAPRPS